MRSHPRLVYRKTAVACMLCIFSLLLNGCVLESETPVLQPKPQASALNIFAEKIPDIAGDYMSMEKPDNIMRLVPVKGSSNAFSLVSLNKQGGEKLEVIVAPLREKDTMLMQVGSPDKRKSDVGLIPARLGVEGITVYPMFSIGGQGGSPWDKEIWLRLLIKHKILTAGGHGERLLAGADPEALQALFSEMFAAKALGSGQVFVRAEKARAIQEKKQKDSAFLALCRQGTPETVAAALKAGADIKATDAKGHTALVLAAAQNPYPEVAELLMNAGISHTAASADGTTPLMAAASSGTLEMVTVLLKAGADPKAKTRHNLTPLHKAAISGLDPDIIMALVKAGGDVNAPDVAGITPLLASVYNPNYVMLKALLLAGADVKAPVANEGSLLVFAAKKQAPAELVREILSSGVDLNAQDNQGKTALLYALQTGNRPLVEQLLEAGANAALGDKEGNSPLSWVMENKDTDLAFRFIKAGADINTRDRQGNTLLMNLARNGRADDNNSDTDKDRRAIFQLLNMGADPACKNKEEQTFITLARENWSFKNSQIPLFSWLVAGLKKAETVEALLNAGADVHEKNAKGTTPFMVAAARTKNVEILAVLLKAGAQVNARNGSGNSALIFAAEMNPSVEVLRYLLQAKADINARNKDDMTPLALAAGHNTAEVVAALLAAGADLQVKNKTGWTPLLQVAYSSKDPRVVATLLAAGANIEERLPNGGTVLCVAAKMNGQPEVVKALLQAGADYNSVDKDGLAPLALAVTNNNPEVVTLLLQAGADVQRQTAKGRTTLDVAAGGTKNPLVIKYLVFAGAEVNGRDKDGVTPLMRAANENKNPAIVSALLDLGADGSAKGGSHNPKTAFEMAESRYNLRDTDVYWQLKDAQYKKPKELSAELQAEKAAYLALIQAGIPGNEKKAQAAAPFPQQKTATEAPANIPTQKPAPTPEQTAPTHKAAEPAANKVPAETPAAPAKGYAPQATVTGTAADAQASAQVVSGSAYPPLTPAANGKPRAAIHKISQENGTVQLALQLLAPGKIVQAIRLDNIDGPSALWRSDGKDNAAPLVVADGDVVLSDGASPLQLGLGDAEKMLTLRLKDTKHLPDTNREFRLTVFFSDSDRAMCLLSAE